MIKLGEINTLEILRETDHGAYLIDNEDNEVLLPNRYVPKVHPPLSLAQLLSNSLTVDEEISVNVKRTIEVYNPPPLPLNNNRSSSGKEEADKSNLQSLILGFSSESPKSLRVCIRSFLDMVVVVLRTVAEFDTTVVLPEVEPLEEGRE